MTTAVDKAKRLATRPGIAHLLRANQRFNHRLGSQFGAAVTYFSVLAVVPILLFAFSVTGFVLTVVDPSGLDWVLARLREALSPLGRTAQTRLLEFIESSLRQWAAQVPPARRLFAAPNASGSGPAARASAPKA